MPLQLPDSIAVDGPVTIVTGYVLALCGRAAPLDVHHRGSDQPDPTPSATGSPQPEPAAVRIRGGCRSACLCPLSNPSASAASTVTDPADSTRRVPQSGSPPSAHPSDRVLASITLSTARHRPPTSESARHRRHSADAPTSQAVRRRPRPPHQPGGAFSLGIKGSGKSSRNYTYITSYPRSSDLPGVSEHPPKKPPLSSLKLWVLYSA